MPEFLISCLLLSSIRVLVKLTHLGYQISPKIEIYKNSLGFLSSRKHGINL